MCWRGSDMHGSRIKDVAGIQCGGANAAQNQFQMRMKCGADLNHSMH